MTKAEAQAVATVSDPRWAQVVARDVAADGTFVYSVKSTGVYCRPSCGSRTARPENITFHASAANAEKAGFRPCKRCRPDQPGNSQHTTVIADLCRFIESSDQPPTLDQLSRRSGISAYHLHRLFKAATGVTPKQYAAAHQAKRIRAELRSGLEHGKTVTEAIYNAGYNTNGRFYEQSNELLGMTPTAYRAGGANTEIRFAVGECSLGSILVAASERGVCAILIGDDPDALTRDLQDRFARARLIGGDAAFEQTVAKVIGFIEAPALGLDLPLDVRGTAFQRRVWSALRKIPAGKTVSYATIARRVGAPTSFRAVGGAIAANPIAVAIPCHRVIRTDGTISGYRWGVDRKRALLERESFS